MLHICPLACLLQQHMFQEHYAVNLLVMVSVAAEMRSMIVCGMAVG